jgi:hypothetical protein
LHWDIFISLSSNWITTKGALGWLQTCSKMLDWVKNTLAYYMQLCITIVKVLTVVALGEMKMKFTIYNFIFFQMDGG